MQASSIANRAAAPKARPPVQRRAGAGRCRAVRVVSYLEAQAAGAKAPEPPQVSADEPSEQRWPRQARGGATPPSLPARRQRQGCVSC